MTRFAMPKIRHKVFIIHWSGPFTRDALKGNETSNVLYLASGRVGDQRKDRLQYCGITEGPIGKRVHAPRSHHRIWEITDAQLWIGQLAHPSRVTRADLEAA